MLPAFPDFQPLNIELKDPYNQFIKDFPPFSDISFTTLQIWWNLSEQLAVSLLNGNLVIDYHQPFDARHSGFSLIGGHAVEDSMHELFQYLKAHHKEAKLIHVPEFVVSKIGHQDHFTAQEEFENNEYLLDSTALAKLEGHDYQLIRKKVRRFVREAGEHNIELRSLDLSLVEAQDQLFRAIAKWENHNVARNDPEHNEHLALKKTLSHAVDLGIKNLAVFVDKELKGLVIYHRPLEGKYYVLHHLKADYSLPFISDFLHHETAKHAVKNHVSILNIEMDLGIENLKTHKMRLRPVDFFRKYTIRPV